MFVAVWLQVTGTSMPCCSKTGCPFSSLITAERSSQVISSKGCRPDCVKWRLKVRPARFSAGTGVRDSALGFSTGWVDISATSLPDKEGRFQR